MPEQILEIVEKGVYKNLALKTRYQQDSNKNYVIKDGKKVVMTQGLDNNGFIIVEKIYPGGMKIDKPTYSFFNCKVKYLDEEVSFILYEDEHEQFEACGGQGDNVKISLTKEEAVNRKTGAEYMRDVLHFEAA